MSQFADNICLATGLLEVIEVIEAIEQSRYKDLSDQSWCELYIFFSTINCGYKSKKSRQFFKNLPILVVGLLSYWTIIRY